MKSKRNELEKQLNYFGYEIQILNDKVGYLQRKSTVYGIFDRRDNRVKITSTSIKVLSEWLIKKVKY